MIFLPTEITNFLDKEVLSYYRDKKIEDVIKDK